MTWQVNGEQHVEQWLAAQPELAARLAMLSFLAALGDDPAAVASAVRRKEGPGHDVHVALVPGTSAFVDYLVVDQFRTVIVLGVVDIDLGAPPPP